jgi:hypothetical protein
VFCVTSLAVELDEAPLVNARMRGKHAGFAGRLARERHSKGDFSLAVRARSHSGKPAERRAAPEAQRAPGAAVRRSGDQRANASPGKAEEGDCASAANVHTSCSAVGRERNERPAGRRAAERARVLQQAPAVARRLSACCRGRALAPDYTLCVKYALLREPREVPLRRRADEKLGAAHCNDRRHRGGAVGAGHDARGWSSCAVCGAAPRSAAIGDGYGREGRAEVNTKLHVRAAKAKRGRRRGSEHREGEDKHPRDSNRASRLRTLFAPQLVRFPHRA